MQTIASTRRQANQQPRRARSICVEFIGSYRHAQSLQSSDIAESTLSPWLAAQRRRAFSRRHDSRISRSRLQTNRSGWIRWLPGLSTLRQYDRAWLRHDIVAGFVMTAMLVPVGIAYAQASGVPGINGLYATVVPLLAYAMFGPSRILVLGPDSALAAVILAVVGPMSGGDPQRAITPAGMMAIVSGIVCVAAGLARLGFLTELLSKPIRYGYMNRIALMGARSQ